MDPNQNQTQPIKDYDGFAKAERTPEAIVSSPPNQPVCTNSAMQNMGIESNDLNSSQNSTMSYRKLQPIPSYSEKSSLASRQEQRNENNTIDGEEEPSHLSPSLTMSHIQCRVEEEDEVKRKQGTRLSQEQVARAMKIYLDKLKRKKSVMIIENDQRECNATAYSSSTKAIQPLQVSKANGEVDSAVENVDENDDDEVIVGSENTNNSPIVASSKLENETILSKPMRNGSHRDQSSMTIGLGDFETESPSFVQNHGTDWEPTIIIDDFFEDPEVSVFTSRSYNNRDYLSPNNAQRKTKRSLAKILKKTLHSIFTSLQFYQVFHSHPKRFSTTSGVEKVQPDQEEAENRQSNIVARQNDQDSFWLDTNMGIGVSTTTEGPEQHIVTGYQHVHESKIAMVEESPSNEIDIRDSFPKRLARGMKLVKKKEQ